MMTDEIFWKLDLECVYSDGIKSKINEGNYVYVIKNGDKYYIGKSRNINKRISIHLRANTNNITEDTAEVYILEKMDTRKRMDIMEYIWIIWFSLNTACINVDRGTYKVRVGKFNTSHVFQTNYLYFCEMGYIPKLPLLDKQHLKNYTTDIELFGKSIQNGNETA